MLKLTMQRELAAGYWRYVAEDGFIFEVNVDEKDLGILKQSRYVLSRAFLKHCSEDMSMSVKKCFGPSASLVLW